jgi:hypothetical protein
VDYMEASARTDVGLVRAVNEDNYLLSDVLFAVADGLGGHEAGEIASKMAVNMLEEYLLSSESDPAKRLREAFTGINAAIYQRSMSDESCKGMGTTLTALLIQDGTAYIGHVGDSRAYLVRKNVIYQLTEDHSVVGELVRMGMLTKSEAKVHPQRNLLTRAMGTLPTVDMEIANSGGAPAYGVKATLTPDYGIVLAPSERSSRFPGQIAPGETCDVSWYLVPFGEAGAFDYRVNVDARNTDTLMTATSIGVPMLRSRLLLETPVSPVEQGKFFIVRILARNLRGFQQVKFDLCFDPSVIEVAYVSRGTIFVEDRGMSEWNEGVIQNPLGLLTDVYGRLTQPEDITGELATIAFRAKAPGQSHVLLRNMSLLGREGQVVVTSVEHGSVIVTDK